jgi:excinuclease ABC subunit C
MRSGMMANPQETARSAPHQPGVYLFKSASGVPIYIGKAKDLRNRVASYFGTGLMDRTAQMVSQASSLEFIVTDNESEAFLLESQLIKQYYPKYNIELKDNQKFTYILITDEQFPRMLLVRRNRGGRVAMKGSLYGPFLSGSAYVLVASTLRKTFRLRTCRLGQKRPCLQYHLGFCMGPCAGLATPEEYGRQVKKLKEALSGGKKLEKVLEELEGEMKKAAKERRFERALELRNSISSLSSLLERQKMESGSEANEDFVSLALHEGIAHVQLFRQLGGVICDRKKFEFPAMPGQDPLSDFLPRFYDAGGVPRRIYAEREPDGKAELEKYLSSARGGPASIIVPEKGDKKKLLELLRKNILLEISGTADPALIELQHELGLPSIPRTIECFDVSNLFGSGIVGSMVQFVNAKPNKSAYRRFKIRSVGGQDDFACMKEIILRRYYRVKKEGGPMPDLIVVDGGPGQLNAALSALSELSLTAACVSLAKEFEEIYHPDKSEPLRLPRSSSALQVLQYARDEAHRFVIAYHRLLRKKKMSE